jgi:AP-4 complex subunit beta-1
MWCCFDLDYVPQDAPYLLEPLVAGFPVQALRIRLALLTAVVKLFFARPPECQGLLGSVLAAAAADTDQDVHDRGLLYHRCASALGLLVMRQ